MTEILYIDASALKAFGCPEKYRQEYILNRAPRKPSVYYQLGIAVHKAVEAFWDGQSFEVAMEAAYQVTNAYPVRYLNPPETKHWMENVDNLPDLISCYFDSVEHDPGKLLMVEKEFTVPYSDGVVICGRVDRVMQGPKLVDVKTASEISRLGVPWKKSYREQMLLDPQFGLYDWWLQHVCGCGHNQNDHAMKEENFLCMIGGCKCPTFKSLAPTECYLEVIMKPYKGKKTRLESVPLNEIVSESYRKRFRQQLAWKVSEIVRYHRDYRDQAPWPMNSNMCTTKYGACPWQETGLCVYGSIPSVLDKITKREEHLVCKIEAAKNNVLTEQTGDQDNAAAMRIH